MQIIFYFTIKDICKTFNNYIITIKNKKQTFEILLLQRKINELTNEEHQNNLSSTL